MMSAGIGVGGVVEGGVTAETFKEGGCGSG